MGQLRLSHKMSLGTLDECRRLWYNTPSMFNTRRPPMGEQAHQPNKRPLCVGLLAHVCANRGEPHNYSPEKFEFLWAFLLFEVF